MGSWGDSSSRPGVVQWDYSPHSRLISEISFFLRIDLATAPDFSALLLSLFSASSKKFLDQHQLPSSCCLGSTIGRIHLFGSLHLVRIIIFGTDSPFMPPIDIPVLFVAVPPPVHPPGLYFTLVFKAWPKPKAHNKMVTYMDTAETWREKLLTSGMWSMEGDWGVTFIVIMSRSTNNTAGGKLKRL